MAKRFGFKPIVNPHNEEDNDTHVGISIYGMVTPPRLDKKGKRGWNACCKREKLKNDTPPKLLSFMKPRSKSANNYKYQTKCAQQSIDNSLNGFENSNSLLTSSLRMSPNRADTLIGFNHYAGAKFSEPPSPAELPQPPTRWMERIRSDKLPFYNISSKRYLSFEDTCGGSCLDMTNHLKVLLKVQA
ncbi:uncharacterized protein LOC143256079 isoform X1 [Tachypleus tridentatus]|uniref:uncharacterized protein LOC143256079 isoform X1 n=1 Tax=Tachypleus tridentatus TaxID=6853 RepID=UPI003FD09354